MTIFAKKVICCNCEYFSKAQTELKRRPDQKPGHYSSLNTA